jgi:acyl carrier protein
VAAAWPEAFEAALRRNLSRLAEDRPIPEGVSLTDLGMDSISTIALLIEIEEGFGVQFPDELLAPEVFATPATLWRAVRELAADRTGLANPS